VIDDCQSGGKIRGSAGLWQPADAPSAMLQQQALNRCWNNQRFWRRKPGFPVRRGIR
jgi:hypothetical protein